jgi:uncharacterized protein
VKVRIQDLDTLGSYMDAALAAGFTDISYVTFKSSQELTLREEARAIAFAQAPRACGHAVMVPDGQLPGHGSHPSPVRA